MSSLDPPQEAASSAMEATRLPRNRQKEASLWAIGAIPEFLVPTLNGELRLSIAQNPNTPAHILEMLAGDSDRLSKIDVALAQNPNTSVSLLEQLAGHHSDLVRESVVYHPKTPLIQQQFQLQLQAVENPETPTDTLKELATSQWAHIRLGVAGHPNTPRDALEQLAGDKDSLIRTSVALNLNSPAGALLQLATDQDPWIRIAVACHLNTPVNLLRQLAEGSHARQAVASNPNTPVSVLEELAQDKSFRVSESLAQNPSTPVRILEELEKHPNDSVQGYAGYNLGHRHNGDLLTVYTQGLSHLRSFVSELLTFRGIPYNMLRGFADRHVRQSAINNLSKNLTQNPDTPSSILQQLAEIKDTKLGVAIALHPNTHESTLLQLVKHQDEKVRTVVAKNPNTPMKVLERLLEDKYRYVRQAAIANLNQNFSQTLNAGGSILNQCLAVQNPETSQETIAQLTTSEWLIIREYTALHPKASTTILEQLAKDKSSAVRSSVAQNPHTPRSLLAQLAQDKDQDVAIAVAQNPNTPVSILEQFAQQGKRNNQIKLAALKNLFSQYPDRVVPFLSEYIKLFQPSFTRLLVFLHPLAPSSFLAKNFDSSSWLERYAIAQNPNTPAAIRQRLAQDGNRIVRAAATNLQHDVPD